MKTKILLLLGFLSISCTLTFSQAQNSELQKSSRIKIYATPSYYLFDYKLKYSRTYYYDVYHYDYELFNAGSISVAFEKQKDNHLSREIEIMPFRISYLSELNTYTREGEEIEYLGGNRFTFFEMYGRYQLTYTFGKGNARFSIGASSVLFLNIFKQKPYVSKIYTMKLKNLGLGFSVLPGMIFRLTENIHFNINIPFRFYEMYVQRYNYENFNVQEKIRKNYSLNSEIMPAKYYLRMGLEFVLDKK